MPARYWTIFSQQDGLLSSDIHTILVDGPTIWVGTAAGVERYDGRWRSYPTLLGAPEGLAHKAITLPFGEVTALAADEHTQQLWAGTRDGRVARWNGDTWHAVASVDAPVRALAYYADALWVATERGLLRTAPNGDTTMVPLGDMAVYALAHSAGHLWAGTKNGLWEVDPTRYETRQVSLRNEQGETLKWPVSAIWVEDDDSMWLGMERWVVGYHPSTGETSTYPLFDTTAPRITGLTGTPDDSIWATSNSGAAVKYLLRGGTLTDAHTWSTSPQDGLFKPKGVRDVAVDQDGSVWFATDVGLYRYQPWAWRNQGAAVDGSVVNDILLDSRGRLWVATAGAGIWAYDGPNSPAVRHVHTPTGLSDNVVCALAEDSHGGIWAGTVKGIARFASGAWTVPIDPQRLPSPVACTLQSDGTDMWIGTTRGLVHYNAAQNKVQVEIPTEGQAINDLAYDSFGRLWVATAGGQLWRRTPGGQWLDTVRQELGAPPDAPVTRLTAAPDLPGAMIASFHGAGIYRWANERWAPWDGVQQANGDQVFALFVDPTDHSLWIGSETGVCRLDDLGCTRYDARDGIQSGAIRSLLLPRRAASGLAERTASLSTSRRRRRPGSKSPT